MNQFARCFRNLLLFALVGWAGVDDYFPSVGSSADSSAETIESVLFDGATFRRTYTAEDFSPLVLRSRFFDRSSGLTGVRVAAWEGRPLWSASTADHLYALMSLRR
ncbi:MAG TPA: hypothetical protein VFG04_18290 [Planctomycetaceae bacterium]|jgi:hypothetical protein|nr:hypothetical protein [Planctomycetaceae bacterium]